METADIVKVAVSAAPYSIDKPYDYLVPEALAESAAPGVRVMVPFGRGNRESEGLILTRSSGPKLQGSKRFAVCLTRRRCWTGPELIWRSGCGAAISAQCLKRCGQFFLPDSGMAFGRSGRWLCPLTRHGRRAGASRTPDWCWTS